MIVLVCGGISFSDKQLIFGVLSALNRERNFTKLIEGGSLGADRLAREWAHRNDIPHSTFITEWKKYGKSAEYIKNKAILEIGKPDLVIAFPGGKGTANMVKESLKHHREVLLAERGKNGLPITNRKEM